MRKTLKKAALVMLLLVAAVTAATAQSSRTTRYTLRINSNAPNALVFINAVQQRGTTPFTIQLNQGTYDIVVRAEGFRDYSTKITLSRNLVVNAQLQATSYLLTVNSSAQNSTVFVNGQSRGPAPARITLPGSTYAIRVTAPGHETYETSVALTRNTAINAQLQAISFQLTVNSTAQNSTVFINGKDSGAAPARLTLPAGTYEVRVTAPGHEPYQTSIDLSRNAAISAQLQEMSYQLGVTSTAQNSTVFIDGQNRGAAPARLTLPAGTYEVRVTSPGHEPYQTSINLGRNTAVSATLAPQVLTVSINSNVKGAMVTVDGNNRGNTPLSIELRYGAHEIRVDASGYEPFLQSVNIQRNTVVNAELRPSMATVEIVFPEESLNPFVKDPILLFTIYVDGEPVPAEQLRTMQFQIMPGRHKIMIVTGGLKMESDVVIRPYSTYALKLDPVLVIVDRTER